MRAGRGEGRRIRPCPRLPPARGEAGSSVPDPVVAELALLGLVHVNGAGWRLVQIRRGRGSGHLIICLLVARGGTHRSCGKAGRSARGPHPSLPPAPPHPPQPRHPGPAAPAGAAPEGGEGPGRAAASPAGAPPRRLPRRRLINNAGPGRGHGPAGASWQRRGPPASDSGRGSAPRLLGHPSPRDPAPQTLRGPTAARDPQAPVRGQPTGGKHGHTTAAGLGARSGPRCFLPAPLVPRAPARCRSRQRNTHSDLTGPTGMGEVHPQFLPPSDTTDRPLARERLPQRPTSARTEETESFTLTVSKMRS